MNIFVTNTDPLLCAEDHCDVHVVKMILETAQMMSTAHRLLSGDMLSDRLRLYRATHENHPCSIWVRSSSGNYQWALQLLHCLSTRYRRHTGRTHKTQGLLASLTYWPVTIHHGDMTPFVQAMPEQHRNEDAVVAYRSYLNSKFHEWSTRERPMKFSWYGDKPSWLS